MSAARWLGDCGDVIAADPYGMRARLLDYAIRARIAMFGDAFGWPLEEQRALYESIVSYDPSFWTIPDLPDGDVWVIPDLPSGGVC